MSYNYWYPYPSTPRRVKGGIKAQSKRGQFGQSWWARRWVEILDEFDLGARLSRGRSYARKGQVASIDVKRGSVTATVQGSGSRPYDVDIRVKELSKSDWERVCVALIKRPVFIAKLLTGQMPDDIENVFDDMGLSLFPGSHSDLDTDCSCPDWSNPCKHIAAVYLLLGEEFDRDPFLLFRLRGTEREELLAMAGLKPVTMTEPDDVEHDEVSSGQDETPESLPQDPDSFWGGADTKDQESLYMPHMPAISAALPKRLGSFPFWRGKNSFIPAMEEMYENASPIGRDIFLGDSQDKDTKETSGSAR